MTHPSDLPPAAEVSPAWLRQILDNSTAVVYVKDRDGRHLFVNRRLLDLFGLREEEVIGHRDSDLFPAEIAAAFRRNDQRVLERNAPIEVEERARTAEGERVYLSVKFPLHDAGGEPYAVCGISTDITERKRIEEALRDVALGVTGATGEDIFQSIVQHLARCVGVDFAFIGKLMEGPPKRIQTLAVSCDGQRIDNIEYDLQGTPCQTVVGKAYQFVPRDICDDYPGDNMLSQMNFESYAGYPLYDSRGEELGLIAVLHRSELERPDFIEAVLRIFSVRAASELERLRVEEQRRASEASYRAIFDASEDAIFVHDIDTGAIVDVNPRACRAYGYRYEEMIGLNVGDLSSGEPPYTLEDAARHLELAKAGVPQRLEWRRRNKDGSLHWDEVLIHRARIGGHDRILAFTREITERKAIEAALRASEEQYRSIFNASVDGMLLCSPEGEIVDANPAFGSMLGFAHQQLIGLQPLRLMPPGSEAAYQAFVDTAITGRTFHTETHALHRDGRAIDVEVHGVQVHYRERPHLLAIVRDITERKQRDAALHKSEDRLRATIEASLDSIISMDGDGRVIEFNPAAEQCFGYRREQVIGRSLADMMIPERLRHAHTDGLARYHERGDGPYLGQRIEVTAMRADGSEFPAELAITVAQGQEGDIFIGYLRDITERKQAEAERGRLEAQLRQAQKMEAIGHLTGGIAHDFNNILTGIMGYMVLAQERNEAIGDEKLARYLERAERSGQRARDLIQQMLTFSRGQRGEPRPLRLAPLIQETVKLLGATLPSSIEISTRLDPDAPSAMLDPVQLEQVLMNLFINARDAMQGSGRIEVVLHHGQSDGHTCASCRKPVTGPYLEIGIHDNGSGITQEVLERMFEPFYSTKEVGKGSGMGLSMVHGIVHEHGGHILVESTPGAGTRIRILLPGLRNPEESPQSPTGTTGTRERGALLQGRILVVDDDEAASEFMEDLLDNWGAEPTVLRDSDAALARFRQRPDAFDLAILDQTMPHMKGLELARHLRDLSPSLPIILYSGYTGGIRREDLEAAGVAARIRKPVDTEELLGLLRRLLPAH